MTREAAIKLHRITSRQWLVGLACLWLAGGWAITAEKSAGVGEYQVKAAFIYNFTKFVDWPPQAFGSDQSPMIIGILGDDQFGEALSTIVQNEKVKDRYIEIRRFSPDEDLSGCHLLFISRSEAGRTAEILQQLKDRPVLTVSEQGDFVQRGGMIDFVLVNNTVRFDISAKALEKVGLKASSKLLAVARYVKK